MGVVPRKHILQLSLPPPRSAAVPMTPPEPALKMVKWRGWGCCPPSSTFLPLWDSQGEGY